MGSSGWAAPGEPGPGPADDGPAAARVAAGVLAHFAERQDEVLSELWRLHPLAYARLVARLMRATAEAAPAPLETPTITVTIASEPPPAPPAPLDETSVADEPVTHSPAEQPRLRGPAW